MKTSLVIMATGLGSRYGGEKQIDGIGPNGEILMEYSIYDALQAGFDKIVFIIKPEMEAMVHHLCGDAVARQTTLQGAPVEVRYAFQDFSSLPSFFQRPADRVKPYGTVHALLCAEDAVQEPCCVINADDYYGAKAYQTMHDALLTLPETGKALMMGYHLKNTASLHGTVSRGVCSVSGDDLTAVKETKKIQLYPDGTLRDLTAGRELDGNAVVSMNYWGFSPALFPVLKDYFHRFLQSPQGQELSSECLLPVMVDDLMRDQALSVQVLRTGDRWFGMTYQEDRENVGRELKKLHDQGAYPRTLWD